MVAMPWARIGRMRRGRAPDWVFDHLASRILRGELAAGHVLPSEREIATKLGVSHMIVREALHRLADHDLISVRHGARTTVRDISQSNDLRVLELIYRLAPAESTIDARDILEKQFLQGLALVEVAARRASDDALAKIHGVVERASQASITEDQFAAFEQEFWTAVSQAGGNRILKMEVGWWYRMLAAPPRPEELAP